MERVTGIEPVYPAWKAGALADVLHPQMWWTNEGVLAHLEKIGTLKKGGRRFFLSFLYIYYTKIFLKNQLIFLETIDNILDMLRLGRGTEDRTHFSICANF